MSYIVTAPMKLTKKGRLKWERPISIELSEQECDDLTLIIDIVLHGPRGAGACQNDRNRWSELAARLHYAREYQLGRIKP